MDKDNILVVCDHEGGFSRPYDGTHAPIRFYSDGRVEDDIFASATGNNVREIVSPERLDGIIRAAIENKRTGYKGRVDLG